MGNGIVHTYQVLDKVYLDIDDLFEFASDETNNKIIIKGRLYQSPQHGHWEAHDMSIKDVPVETCSICGKWSYGYCEHYCPKCGAKMDEVKE